MLFQVNVVRRLNKQLEVYKNGLRIRQNGYRVHNSVILKLKIDYHFVLIYSGVI
jgi:hypothetical protein